MEEINKQVDLNFDEDEPFQIQSLMRHLELLAMNVKRYAFQTSRLMDLKLIAHADQMLLLVDMLKTYPISDFSLGMYYRCINIVDSIVRQYREDREYIDGLKRLEREKSSYRFDSGSFHREYGVSKYLKDYAIPISVDVLDKLYNSRESILDLYAGVYFKVTVKVEQILPEYRIKDLVRMMNDYYKKIWNKGWSVVCKKLTDQLKCNEGHRVERLNEMRMELQKQLEQNKLGELHYEYQDVNTGVCDYEGMLEVMFQQIGIISWDMDDLNEYLLIIIKREYVESMLAGRGVPLVHDLIATKNGSIGEERPYQKLFNDFASLFQPFQQYMKEPYSVDDVLSVVEDWLITENMEMVGVEFVKFIKDGRGKHKYGEVLLTPFCYFLQLLMDCKIMSNIGAMDVLKSMKTVKGFDDKFDPNMSKKAKYPEIIKNELIERIKKSTK